MIRGKRVQPDLATCRRLLGIYGDKKLSGVIKQLEAKAKPKPRGRKGKTEAQLLELYGAVKAIQQSAGCSLSEARRRYARHMGLTSARHVERLHLWAGRLAELLWSEQDLERAVTDMQSQLQAKGVLRAAPNA